MPTDAVGTYAHSGALAGSTLDPFCNFPAQAAVGAPVPFCTPDIIGLEDQTKAYLKDVGDVVPDNHVMFVDILGNDIALAASLASEGEDPAPVLEAAVLGRWLLAWTIMQRFHCHSIPCP